MFGLGRFWKGGKAEAEFRVRNAGPGVAIPTAIRAVVAIPGTMSLDDVLLRRARLVEVIPQYKQKGPARVRKLRARYAAALSGAQGDHAKASAEWLLAHEQEAIDAMVAKLEQKMVMYDEAIRSRMEQAGVR